jgi:RNA polymerase sigma-70 factor (ECF subfamily)
MSEPEANSPSRKGKARSTGSAGDDFVCAFNGMRTELVSTLYYFLGNYEDAQDAVQETFIKCWRSLVGTADIRNMRAWIFRVGVNAAKDLQRNAYRRRSRPLTGTVQAPGDRYSPVIAAEEREAIERLQHAILSLRPDEQEVFLLRQNGCLTFEEIADLRRAPVGTVKTQMRAAIAKLRQVLQEK